MIDTEKAAPCRHAGAPSEGVVALAVNAIMAVAADQSFLAKSGLTPSEFELALPAAIQRIRGSSAASNLEKREFLRSIIDALKSAGIISAYTVPKYNDDTVYRLTVPSIGEVAIIQKGCPDGAHSSVKWSRPEWADEVYLWWLCDSLAYHPGEHVAKGVNRLRKRFFDEKYTDGIDGVLFHNSLCGSPSRPCPKIGRAISIDNRKVPPPCIWVMPERSEIDVVGSHEWNWDGARTVKFPALLLSLFGITSADSSDYQGHIGFSQGARGTRTNIVSRFGAALSQTYRGEAR